MNLRPLIFLLCLGSAAFVQANSKETLSVQGKQQPPASLATPLKTFLSSLLIN